MYVLKFIFFVAHCWGEILRIVGLIISIKKQVSSVSYFLRVQIYEHFIVTPRKSALFSLIIFHIEYFANYIYQKSHNKNKFPSHLPYFYAQRRKKHAYLDTQYIIYKVERRNEDARVHIHFPLLSKILLWKVFSIS